MKVAAIFFFFLFLFVFLILFIKSGTSVLEEQIRRLHDEIRFELYRQSALLPGDHSYTSSQPTEGHLCSIPTNVEKHCIDDINFSRAADPNLSCPLEELSHNCELLIALHGYRKPVDREEINFPLAFGLKMHKSPEQAEQLLRTIYRPHNVYCIHVDKKASESVFRKIASVASCFPNVFLTNRFTIVYAGFSVVEAEMELMKCALKSGVDWKYYLNLAGQEFPLKTNLEMVRILKILNGTNDFESYPTPTKHGNRVSYEYAVEENELVMTSRRKQPPPFKVDIRKGSQYGSFSRPFVESVLTDKNAMTIIRYFNDSYSPDETVWATLNAYPGMAGGYSGYVREDPVNERISRAIIWDHLVDGRCRGSYLRGVCLFGEGDLPWLLRQPNLIANKFVHDSPLLPCLEAVLTQRAQSKGQTFDQWHVMSLPHVMYHRMCRKVPHHS